jgi:hypothetical protein
LPTNQVTTQKTTNATPEEIARRRRNLRHVVVRANFIQPAPVIADDWKRLVALPSLRVAKRTIG